MKTSKKILLVSALLGVCMTGWADYNFYFGNEIQGVSYIRVSNGMNTSFASYSTTDTTTGAEYCIPFDDTGATTNIGTLTMANPPAEIIVRGYSASDKDPCLQGILYGTSFECVIVSPTQGTKYLITGPQNADNLATSCLVKKTANYTP